MAEPGVRDELTRVLDLLERERRELRREGEAWACNELTAAEAHVVRAIEACPGGRHGAGDGSEGSTLSWSPR